MKVCIQTDVRRREMCIRDRSIGMPLNFGEIGAKEEDIKKMAHTACYGNGRKGTVGKFVRLGEEAVSYTHLDVYKRQY